MTLTIQLTAAEEARLSEAAQDRGVEPAEFARQLISGLLRSNGLVHESSQTDSERHRGLDELVVESQKLGMY